MLTFPRPPEFIETPRLRLRARSMDHAPELYRLVDSSRSSLRPWMPWEAQTQAESDSEDYLTMAMSWWTTGKNFDFTVFGKESGRMVGSFGLHTIDWDNRSCHVGFWLGSEFEGKGYVTEALQAGEKVALELGFHRLILTCDSRNKRSAAVAVRNGYRLEAKQIDECRDRGTLRDTLFFVKLINPELPGQTTENLPVGFSIKDSDSVEFWSLVDPHLEKIFDDSELILRTQDVLSEPETAKLKDLGADFKRAFVHHSLLLRDGDLAGWTWGYQDSRESYYMVNSAVLPEYRGRGLYTRLLDVTVKKLEAKGFQRIWSRHNMTNNAVIVPKLKRGFLITGTELSDSFGTLVHLSYYTNPIRRKVMDFRAGHIRPDNQLKSLFKL